MRTGTLPDGSRGVDLNRPVTADTAAAFAAAGFRFVVRYVLRDQTHSYDLTVPERDIILNAGLGLMVVQHVAPEGWSPSASLGTTYGQNAGSECGLLGLPDGMSLWCDLEGVAVGTDPEAVIGYCNAWFDAVKAHGYSPSLYVGWQAGLDASDLYHRTKFQGYWRAYNLDADQVPLVRGCQMRQSVATADDLIPGFTNQDMDVDVITADALGGTPTLVFA